MTLLPIENREDVVKHKESAAILAADLNAYHAHLNKRRTQKSIDNRITLLEDKVRRLESIIDTLVKTS